MSKKELIIYIKNINGLVGAVDGDTEKHVRNLIYEYNKICHKYDNLKTEVKVAAERLKKEIDRLIERKAIVSDTKEKFVSDFNQEIDGILKTIDKWLEDVI